METVVKKLYEAMFLVDSARASELDAVFAAIKNVLERAEADIVSIKKWDERRLAYQINGKTRGTYILCYFRAQGSRIRDIERDVQLSERIMRVLILSAEHIKQDDVEKDPILRGPQKQQKAFGGPPQKDRKMGTQKGVPAIKAEKHEQEASEAPAQTNEVEPPFLPSAEGRGDEEIVDSKPETKS